MAKPRKRTAAPRKRAVPSKLALAPQRLKARKAGTIPIEVDPTRIEETLVKFAGELRHWTNKGRYTKVRFKFRGKQLLPDLPLAAVVAAEGLTFFWGGILRALVVNVAGKSLLDVELVHDSENVLRLGKEALLAGDLDEARGLFEKAIAMERDNPRAHLSLGVALKLQGLKSEARTALRHAMALDEAGPVGLEAAKVLKSLEGTGEGKSP